MPPKIRQLKARLLKAGFTVRSGKGSHTVWHHPSLPEVTVTLSGNEGRDARPYQVDDVENAIKELREDK
ncbi:type II toxin-antitoxin system HicA family toxin [Ktedonosporobacter rubrisoli]|uniref:Type II toxin-antitoxin system HicA family toxin n=1 Tax=Ktedonosporobacter rubrisoli TaxID=2509675 RepID=A0A4P6K1H6_KTERU|nr:type II toxin-antitoxin system HicA family toxin [Ktedonosporobacter rubrisoli]